jgi:hypothetical protein
LQDRAIERLGLAPDRGGRPHHRRDESQPRECRRGRHLPRLVWSFVEEFSKAFGKSITTIAKEDMAALQRTRGPATFVNSETWSNTP